MLLLHFKSAFSRSKWVLVTHKSDNANAKTLKTESYREPRRGAQRPAQHFQCWENGEKNQGSPGGTLSLGAALQRRPRGTFGTGRIAIGAIYTRHLSVLKHLLSAGVPPGLTACDRAFPALEVLGWTLGVPAGLR